MTHRFFFNSSQLVLGLKGLRTSTLVNNPERVSNSYHKHIKYCGEGEMRSLEVTTELALNI